MKLPTRVLLLSAGGVLSTAACLVQPADWAASAILQPQRRPVTAATPSGAPEIVIRRGEVDLHAWFMPAKNAVRPLAVVLHGIADNRASGVGIAQRLNALGHDVLLPDLRAHGSSGGPYCTYGVQESLDLRAWIDSVGASRVVLLGVSLGAAVALQSAAQDPRVRGVVAVSCFADLSSIVQERAPRFLRGGFADRAVRRAGERAGFDPGLASPVGAAAHLTQPVFLLHGAQDKDTAPENSRRIAAALRSPHRLVIVPGFGHDGVLGAPGVWDDVVRWLAALD